MNSYSHPSAPHIICTSGDRLYIYVNSSQELTESIAKAGKASLVPVEKGAWSQEWRIKVCPPDMDTDKYMLGVEIPDKWNTLDYGTLGMIHSFECHLRKNLAPLHLTIEDEEPPSYQSGWLYWTIIATPGASARARLVASTADYEALGKAASTARDDGHLADIYANTEDPGIPTLLRRHVELCQSLADSATRLAVWQEEKHPIANDWPWMDSTAETAEDGTKFTRTTIAEQARSQAVALERAARDARQLEHLATA